MFYIPLAGIRIKAFAAFTKLIELNREFLPGCAGQMNSYL
jgi:hypothetical protein